jgi:hypothetical protein
LIGSNPLPIVITHQRQAKYNRYWLGCEDEFDQWRGRGLAAWTLPNDRGKPRKRRCGRSFGVKFTSGSRQLSFL